MKRILFILVFITIGQFAVAQSSDFSLQNNSVSLSYPDYGYDYYDRESEISYSVLFYEEEQMYSFYASWVLHAVMNDQIYGMTLSSGYFRRNGENVHLYDTATGLVMEARIEDDLLTFVKGYELLMNKSFISQSADLDQIETEVLADSNGLLKIKREATFEDKWPAITPGHYSIYPTYFGLYGLNLERNGTFVYATKQDIKVLQGTWSQDGNLIILHDEHTDHDFYLIYEEPNLRTMLLPGDTNLEGTVLMPQ